jgi:hypothetical protein
MSSQHSTPLELDTTASQVSADASGSTLPNAFGRMMQGGRVVQQATRRDTCKRPTPTYNHNYDPFKKPSDTLPHGYSPYVFGEPLFDDRAVIIKRLPKHHIIAGPSKRPRTSWVWHLGYALINDSKKDKPTIWACKHCTLIS